MKGESRSILSLIGVALLIASGVAVTAQAQNREKYVISAKAGGVNLVSGNVTVQRNGVGRPAALTANDNLETGDSVTTGAGGRVEVLLNPGTYMRMDENSEFELAIASLDDLRVKLVKGSALIEATGDNDTKLAIDINTPQTEVMIVKRGIYRFNVLPNEMTEIVVRKGQALLGLGKITIIKGGQKILVGHGHAEVAKLDKNDEDAFDLWSKQRAELLAKANQRLQGRTLMAAFNTQHWPDLFGFNYGFGYGFSASNSGFWLYNPNYRSYCFVPHGSRNWSSPYGHPYRTGVEFQNPGGGGQGWTRGSGSQPSGNGYPGRSNNPTSGNSNPSSGNGSSGGSGSSNPMPASQPISPSPSMERSIAPAAQSHIDRASGDTRNPNE